jgi:hypothetical protein
MEEISSPNFNWTKSSANKWTMEYQWWLK